MNFDVSFLFVFSIFHFFFEMMLFFPSLLFLFFLFFFGILLFFPSLLLIILCISFF